MDAIQKEPYFYGNISREDAEFILWDRGCLNGMYLLRSSQTKDAAYVLSLCYDKSVHHYRIKQSVDNLYFVHGAVSEKFSSLTELVKNIHGLICQPSIACNKPLNKLISDKSSPLSDKDIQIAVKNKAQEWGLEEKVLHSALNGKNNELYTLLMKTLHESQTWFHGKISRQAVEERLQNSGHADGKFIIRERNDCSYALCLSYSGETKHYKIDVTSTGEFRIQDGPRFENLLQLVSHYTLLNDGLWCCLKDPCSKPDVDVLAQQENNKDIEQTKVKETINNPPLSSKIPPPVSRKKTSAPPPPLRKPSCSSLSQEQDLPSPLKSPINLNYFQKIEQITRKEVMPENSESKNKCNNVNSDNKIAPSALEKCTSPVVEGCVKTKKPLMPFRKKDPENKEKENKKKDDISKNEIDRTIKCGNSHDGKSMPDLSPVINQLKQQLSVNEDTVKNKHELEITKNDSLLEANDEPVYQIIDPEYESNSGHVGMHKEAHVNNLPSAVSSHSLVLFPNDQSHWLTTPQLTNKPITSTSKFPSSTHDLNHVLKYCKNSCKKKILTSKFYSKVPALKDTNSLSLHAPLLNSNKAYSSSKVTLSSFKPALQISNGASTDSKLETSSLVNTDVEMSKWDEGSQNKKEYKRTVSVTRKPTWTKEESEHHFRTIRKFRRNPMNIHSKNIVLKEKLGTGNFGKVYKAHFMSENVDVPFAVKMLKSSIASAKTEMLQEAQLMTGLDHPNIVRLIGICEDTTIMLIMELAPLGPLNLYLKNHSDVPVTDVLQIMLQVVLGMEYLEGRQFVHRDLAARNVLLVNENFAKISDFGMSKALGLDQDYYRMQPSGKLPLKWYAPECIYFFKFSSKSDVWSYGITLWEAMSFGEKPYLGMTGQEILKMFSDNKRLEKPPKCPNPVYDVMLQCWQFNPEDRPSFDQLYRLLQNTVDLNSD